MTYNANRHCFTEKRLNAAKLGLETKKGGRGNYEDLKRLKVAAFSS
jgi:hypothetical protein